MFNRFQKYSKVYTSSQHAGAAYILNKSFGYPSEQVVPLSISHGVDFDHCSSAMDVRSNEPLHWAYNDSIGKRASEVKSVVRLPHPWWFVTKDREANRGEKILVIGPPPGEINDTRLLALLRRHYKLKDLEILIKNRGVVDRSKEFWMANEVETVSAGQQDALFYERLAQLLAGYEKIVCPTFSSAGIFAAAMGKPVSYLGGYKYFAYDSASYLNIVNFRSASARRIVKAFVHQDQVTITRLAQQLLGFENRPLDSLKSDYVRAISEIKKPTSSNSFLASLNRELAIFFGKPGLAGKSGGEVLSRIFRPQKVALIEIDELSVWLNGLSSNNFSLSLIPYVKGRTEPGLAPDIESGWSEPSHRL
jgi:hypothetical protein